MATMNASYPVFCGAATSLPPSTDGENESVPTLVVAGGGGGGKHGIKNAISVFAPKNENGSLSLWSLPPPRMDTGEVCCSALAIGGAGRVLVAAVGSDLRVYLLRSVTDHVEVGRLLLEPVSGSVKAAEVVDIVFDGGGHLFVVGHADGRLQAFDLLNGESLRRGLAAGTTPPDARLEKLWDEPEAHDAQVTGLCLSPSAEAAENSLLLSVAKNGMARIAPVGADGTNDAFKLNLAEGVPTPKKLAKVFCRGAAWIRTAGSEPAAFVAGLGPIRGPTYVGLWTLKGKGADAGAETRTLVKVMDGPCTKIAACLYADVVAVGTSDGFVCCLHYDAMGNLMPTFRTREPAHSLPVTVLAFPPSGDAEDPLWTLASASADWNVAFMRPSFEPAGGMDCLMLLMVLVCLLAVLGATAFILMTD